MKSLIEVFIVVYLFITNALAFESSRKKITKILEDYENMDQNLDGQTEKDSEFFTLSEKRRKRSSAKNKFLSLAPEIMPIVAPETPAIPYVDEKRKLVDNFNQRVNNELTPNPIYTPSQNLNYLTNNNNNNINLNEIMNANSNLNNNNLNNNFIQLRNYDNSFHRSQYFGNSNEYLVKKKNEELEKKYASYRKPEYVHTNFKTVSNFPSEDNLNEVFDDPVFLEGKLEDQSKLKVKVAVKVADRYDKLNLAEENRNETANSQEIVFNSNQMDFNSNYKYSKAKIINEKDSDSISNNASEKINDLNKKRNEKKIKVTEATQKINNFTEKNYHNDSQANKTINKNLALNFNETKVENLHENKVFNDKKELEKRVFYRNITIEGEKDFKKLEQDMKILKFDFFNSIELTEYLKKNKLLRLNVDINFRNNESYVNETKNDFNNNTSKLNKTSSNKNVSEINNTSKILFDFKKDRILKNKTHLENKIKDFIAEKILNKTLNVSNINKFSKKEIKRIVKDFHAKEIQRINKTIVLKNNENLSSLNDSIVLKKENIKNKKEFKQINNTQLLFKNLDKISERLTTIFKKVLKDIVLNPTDYILEGKLENNFSIMKEEIKNSLSESVEIPAENKTISLNKNENNTHSEITKKANEITNTISHNKTKMIVSEVIKNLTLNSVNKSNEINFIQTKSNEKAKKNNLNNKSSNNNFTKICNNEINSLINKKVDDSNNKIQFILKKSYSKKIAVALQTNPLISSESKAPKNNKLTELDHKVIKHIKENSAVQTKLNLNANNLVINKTKEEKHNTVVLIVKNKTEIKNTPHGNSTKFETQKNISNEFEKKIISQLPKIKQMLEKNKLIDSIQNEISNKLNKSSSFIINHNSTENSNKKDELKNSIPDNNKTNSTRNSTVVSKPEIKKNQEEKAAIISSNLKKEMKIVDKANLNNKSIVSNSSNIESSRKIVNSIFSQDLNNLHPKKIQVKKAETKHEDLEIDDGSVMAEILKAYKKKLRNRKD